MPLSSFGFIPLILFNTYQDVELMFPIVYCLEIPAESMTLLQNPPGNPTTF
jgi:hypothetical protein